LVLMTGLAAVSGLSSAGSGQASRGSAGQQAYALAEEGISNALAVLDAAPMTQASGCGNDASDYNWGGLNAVKTTTESTGTVTWSGSLSNTTCALASGTYTWTLSATGSVKNPTGPSAANVTRSLTR